MPLAKDESQRKLDLEALLRHPGWKVLGEEAASRMAGHGRMALQGPGIDDRKRADHAIQYRVLASIMEFPADEIRHLTDKERREA
jgi:hypothetical protein